MTTPQPISFVGATADFRAGKATPRDLLEGCLARVEEFEPTVGAFVCHDIAAARSAADRSAERWRAGRPLSPIDGMPLGIKDIIETADMATEQGSPLFVGCHTGRDAASVAALREAGAVILGKVVTTEFASTEPRGTRNPWDSARTPGGSSSGSAAAVACGMVPAALGTQVVGSILRPASFCGCVGFKPSVGGINRGGQLRLLQPELVGWDDASTEARRAFEAAVARLAEAGIAIADHHADPAIEEVEDAIADAAGLTRQINAWEGRWPLNTYRNRDRSKLSQSALDRLATAEAMTLADYGGAIARRQHNRKVHARLAGRYDAAITLAAPGVAPVGLGSTGNPVFNVPASMLGIPALSLPVLSAEGLPLGLQIMGFAGQDAGLFAIGAAVRDLLGAMRSPARAA
jgi:Asp-tRNA(Asn)/Glu-tRNA(Gln) amidotransferase A subunit family amidase